MLEALVSYKNVVGESGRVPLCLPISKQGKGFYHFCSNLHEKPYGADFLVSLGFLFLVASLAGGDRPRLYGVIERLQQLPEHDCMMPSDEDSI